ncbi:efflux RND transporter permease subunit [Myroides odoratimimus]|uniref:Hydrophobe/amphiphile efflux-1 (HAE1) family RND transporter n=1 Tax=Myroides odoratimimus CCUG 10230 TaxID=883150 RepID=A0ABN0E6T0_9FLAO|nr:MULTISPECIES: efflux RND transporter permease subunit [Myroides]AJA68012.1 Hydrophobe/Amphiphile Efflux-1 (HAE1) Family-containing protein [Myroides sp. A21]EHO06677.1 hydrophobe/amphiphile efflux-1 (HAE1) family RND transporter [Myroides odoratimimus CCUG 10230]EKB02981.1 hydrophobe/amphiphile efflux-1 (HAE1) family RND transporter [Myroides odoratimimus CCUG 3837]MDM1064084.1 efflux RND transporter permease subunit [Myroides odoratimimus]MDM1083481.1 efflux RND transporter permease subuni
MLKTFIERPVLSTVISILIVILGVLGLTVLPVTQYPDIAPPTVQIAASYPGANAETVMQSVVIPIEEQVNGVENMDYITSTASNDGSASIQVVFKQGVDPDIAAVNVQNRVARATPLLPAEVTRSGVTTQKQQTSALMFLSFYSTSPNYDAIYIQNYMNINVIPVLKRVSGVGDAQAFGSRNYSMRIWIDPAKMKAYGLVPSDVVRVLNEQSLEAAAGQLGENNAEAFQYVIKYSGKYKTQDQYENIVVKSLGNGQVLYLKDVAKIELGAMSYVGSSEQNGHPAVAMAIYQTPGSNAQEIIQNLHTELENMKTSFPDGINYTVLMDTNEFLDASISKVISTLIEAFLLVFVVVYIFLQDFRSTLIPLIAVPVAIIGTFFFLSVFGFSINLLTLFALVLAIGIVVDDAIVVVEAVHAKMEETGQDAKEASLNTMSEISGAIISITLVMSAVFIPVTFIPGPTGVFYKQFGITLIVAILISAVNALTLSPALCALFLTQHGAHGEGKKRNFVQRFFDAFNVAFNKLTHKYGNSFKFLLKHKWTTFAILLACLGITYYAAKTMPSGFVPNEDRGFIMGNIELPAGASQDRVTSLQQQFSKVVQQIPGVEGVTIVSGFSFINGQGSNYGMAMIKLDDFKDRTTPELATDAIIGKLFGIAATQFQDARMIFFQPPSIPGFGMSSGFEMKLLDKTGGALTDFDQKSKEYLGALMQRPEILYAQSSFNTNYAQYELDLNIPRAKESGVLVSDIFSALQGYIGGIYAADFTRFGKQYRVMVQSLPEYRSDKNSLNEIYVRTASGEMTPVTQFVDLKKVYGPQSVNRYNLFTSSNITGAPKPGYSSGDAIKAVQEVAAQTLSTDYGIDFTGLSREEISSGNQTVMIFALCIIFVYFLLSAQYESYLLPLAVILSLPTGIMGAFIAQKYAGLENNIYFQIALVMLVGLLAKNAILIVEFALQRRQHGESIAESAINGAKARLRPILMTSFAFILGMMPLVFAKGVGDVGNRSIGTGAAFGLLIGTILGVFVIPVLYAIFQYIQEKIKPIKFVEHKSE